MICITGSNGKTTTTSLIYHIFKKAGMNVGLAGNIGQSLAYQVAECNYDYYVIELSSFQLDNMYKFHANIAVLMNITPDHLDRYDHQMQTMWMPNSALSRTRPRTMPSSSGTMTPSSSVNYTNMAFMAITTLCRKERGRNRRIRGTGQGLFYRTNRFQHGTGGTGADRNP